MLETGLATPRKMVVSMDPTLLTGLIVLVYSLTSLSTVATIYLINRLMSPKPSKDKPFVVQVEPQEKDNSYTQWAAQAQARGAEQAARIAANAQIEVAKLAAKAAADNRDAEQARLERVRLEQAKKLV